MSPAPLRHRPGAAALREADQWLERFRQFCTAHLDALATELARGKRERRT